MTLDAPLVGFAIPPPESSRRGSNAPLADKHFWDSFLGRGLSKPGEGQEYHKPFPFAVLELKVCVVWFICGRGPAVMEQVLHGVSFSVCVCVCVC